MAAIWSLVHHRGRPSTTVVLSVVAAVAVVIEAWYAIIWRLNDFALHLVFGAQFLAGEPYTYGRAVPFYPLARLWFDGGLASLPYHACRALCYVAAVISIGMTLRMWTDLAARTAPLPVGRTAHAIGWTIAVLLPFVIRDLDECGLQFFLLFFLTAAGYCLAHGRRPLAGFWLATAIVYKATPMLFLPLLVWKREWRAAAWTVAFTAVLSALPATYLGWDATVANQKSWFKTVTGILEQQEAYPSSPGFEPPKPQNVSLRAAIARYVETYPLGHPIYSDHPLFVQFGALPPRAAKAVVTGVVLALGAVIAWRMRRRWSGPATGNADFAPEWAAACLFVAILSPLCWRQHLVTALPCVYLVARERLHPLASGGWRKWTPAIAGAVFLLGRRQIIGEDLARLALSYKFDTFAILAYLALALTLPVRSAEAAAVAAPTDEQPLAESRLPALAA